MISGFTEEEARRLTGISVRQLRYWAVTSFFAPSIPGDPLTGPLYSFRDLVCLKVLGILRNETRVPLPHLREVKESLRHLGEDVWAKTTLYVLNRRVVVFNPETASFEEPVSKQGVLELPLKVVAEGMDNDIQKIRSRKEASIGKVQRQKGVAHNQPVVAGTRIQVSSIKAFSQAGYSIEAIQREYPSLTPEDIEAALNYAEAA